MNRVSGNAENPRQLLHSIVRSFQIVELLSEKGELGVTEIDATLGIDKSTAYRILATLREMGYVRQNPANRKYSNTPKFLLLGGADPDMQHIRDRSRPLLKELSDRVGEAVNLGFLDGSDIVYTERIQCDELIQVNLPVGQRMPAYCSALGKAILAHMSDEAVEALFSSSSFVRFTEWTLDSMETLATELETIRTERYARDVQESHRGLSCLAAPVFGAAGTVVAGISVSFPTFRHPDMEEAERKIVPALLETAERIGMELGYRRWTDGHDLPGAWYASARKRMEE